MALDPNMGKYIHVDLVLRASQEPPSLNLTMCKPGDALNESTGSETSSLECLGWIIGLHYYKITVTRTHQTLSLCEGTELVLSLICRHIEEKQPYLPRLLPHYPNTTAMKRPVPHDFVNDIYGFYTNTHDAASSVLSP